MKTRSYIAFLAGLLLILMQQSAFVHAAEHDFHEAEASCEIFIAIENTDSSSDVLLGPDHIPFADLPDEDAVFLHLSAGRFIYFHTRAPPPIDL